MTPEQLKNSILQLAIEGKLVPQDKSEGTGAELLKTLQSASLTAPLVRGAKKALPPVTPEEEPFAIPDNWCWCRLGECCDVNMGQSPDGDTVGENKQGIEFHQGKIYFGDDYLLKGSIKTSSPTKIAKSNSILLCVRAPVGTVNIVDREICIGRGLCAISSLWEITPKFMLFFLRTFASDFEKKATGSTFKAISGDIIKNQPFPLPPLAEQKRIVAKLEELLPLVEEYAEYYDQLQKLNQEFPGKLKKALLQFAIEGKLVPQDKSEGTGADLLKTLQSASLTAPLVRGAKKALPPVTSEEEPFAIPDNWCWCRLGEIFFLQAGKNISASSIFPKNIGGLYPCYGGNGLRGYVENYNVEGNYPLIGRQGALCGNINVASGKFYATEHAVVVYLTDSIDLSYVVYALRVLNLNQYATATAQPGLAVGKLNETVFPLPPLAEQKRIVAKLEELLPLCESLESR